MPVPRKQMHQCAHIFKRWLITPYRVQSRCECKVELGRAHQYESLDPLRMVDGKRRRAAD